MTSTIQTPSRFKFCYPLVGGVLICAALAGGWFLLRTPTSPVPNPAPTNLNDPRVSYQGPFKNIHPDVQAVGSDKCAECHSDIAQHYSKHPMGMSILPTTFQPLGDLKQDGNTSCLALGSQFRLDRTGDHLWCTETRKSQSGERLFDMKADINYVIGSGNKGHSFLSVRDGFVTQTAISWFTQKHVWDESPGFPPQLHIGRPIQVECLYCHANEVVPVKGTTNRYEEPLFRGSLAVGCERCHGPGSEHVRLRETKMATEIPDYSIVNPRHLSPSLREAVCQQCHLAGETRVLRVGLSFNDFRPGLPLDSVIRVIVKDHRGEDRKAVNHVEQMYQSKCYSASNGALGCITCHDPHEKAPPEKRAIRYRAACLKCHDCSSPVSERAKVGAPDNCTACHMPQFSASDIVHAATTDHRIVRTRERAKTGDELPKTASKPLLFFPSQLPDYRDPKEARDYAIALVTMAREGKLSGVEIARDVLPLLERAIAEMPEDYRAWDAKSYALQYAGRKSEAFAAAQTVLTLLPDYESGLTHAAMLAFEGGHIDKSLTYWRKATTVNPRSATYRQELANILAKTNDWPAAGIEAEEAVRLDPALATAHTILAISQLHAGNRVKADEAYRVAELLDPPNLNELKNWYNAERSRK